MKNPRSCPSAARLKLWLLVFELKGAPVGIAAALLNAIDQFSLATPKQCALQGAYGSLSYSELARSIEDAAHKLNQALPTVLGVAIENDPVWAVVDLAAMSLEVPVVPLPYFFSAKQMIHAIDDAGIDVVISDRPILFREIFSAHGKVVEHERHYQLGEKILTEFVLQASEAPKLPPGTAKITYTSGTTGTPKGVCLSELALHQVTASLLQLTGASARDRHLSVLPLSTLLENVAGVYVPLLAGATAILLPSVKTGLNGAAGLDPHQMMAALRESNATTTVLTPELLGVLVTLIEAGQPQLQHLRFIAVGGASVAPRLLKRAEAVGLHVYEGYGLSECASVVALNIPGSCKPGSVGKLLPHVDIRLAGDGEILVAGSNFLGYVGSEADAVSDFWPTGDLGYQDDEGFLYITGRKKNVFITSFGRNVAPEWVERELTLSPMIAQAAVFGEARPWNIAIICPARNAVSEDIDLAIAEINQGLPDYARVRGWFFADTPFSPQNAELTANGRLRREVILKNYQSRINAMYEELHDERTNNAIL